MFTGIIQTVGKIIAIKDNLEGVRLSVDAGSLNMKSVAIGDSIAINGACMTVTSISDNTFTVDVSKESLSKTASLNKIGPVNLEKALALGDALGGHLVSGHVDGLGEVASFKPVGESYELKVLVSKEIGKYLAYKGSVAIDGVSLTVNEVIDSEKGTTISINLIPHTLEVTTLKDLTVGKKVNVEIDLIARYVERMMSAK